MAQQYHRSGRGSNRNRHDDNSVVSPFTQHTPRPSSGVSQGAQNSIDDIDKVLADNDASRSLYNPSDGTSNIGSGHGSPQTDSKKAGKEDLLNQEENSGDTPADQTENATDNPQEEENESKLKRFSKKVLNKKNRKRAGIGAAAGGGIAGLLIAGLMFLGPLKLISTMTNLRNEFFAPSYTAGTVMNSRLFQSYLIQKVIPGMNGACSSTLRDRSCAKLSPGSGPVAALYTAWRDSNLEGRMARNYGIEIIRRSNTFYLRAPGLNGDLDLGTYNGATRTLNGNPYAKLNRTDVRRISRAAVEGETFGTRVRYRYSVGRLLERKYGIRRCLWVCTPGDNRADKRDSRRNALKLWTTERILMPRSEMMGLAISCALSDFNCKEPGDPNNDGERQSQFQKDVLVSLRGYQRVYGTRPLADLEAEADKVRQFGVTQYIVRKLAGDLLGDTASKIIGKAIPIFGWLDAASSIYKSAENAGPAIKHMNYVMNVTSAVALASMAFTSGDEQKTGKVDGTVQGSVAGMFDQVPGGNQGGGAMEATPLYNYMMNGTAGQTRSASILQIFSPKAYAAEAQPKVTAYTCDDGKLVPKGELVCPEMGFGVLSTVGKIADTISGAVSNLKGTPVDIFADTFASTFGWLYRNTIGWVAGKLGSIVTSAIPDAVKQATYTWIQDNIMSKILVQQLGDNPSGGRNFEVAALGVNQMANDTAQFVQGGRALTPAESAAVYNASRQERYADFAAKPLYARLFDKEDSSSMVSRLALRVPSNSTSFAAAVGSFMTNPLSSLMNSFSTILAPPKVNAFRPVTSPFGLPTYGYPVNSPVLQPGFDPEKYWKDNNCDDPELKKKWGAKATELDQNTMVPIQRTEEPCMLIRSSVAEGGGMMDTNLLLEDPVETAAAAQPGAGGGPIPTGDAVALANQILAKPDIISFQTASGKEQFSYFAANGKTRACSAVPLSPILLGSILKLSESYKLVLGVFNDGHDSGTPTCGDGFHHSGTAVDINGVNPLGGGTGTGTNIRYEPAELPILRQFFESAGAVLAGIGGGGLGQKQCIGTPLPKVPQPPNAYFNDTCNHIHMDTRGK